MSHGVGLSIECLLYAGQFPSVPSDNIGKTKSQVINMSQLTYSGSLHSLCTSNSCKRGLWVWLSSGQQEVVQSLSLRFLHPPPRTSKQTESPVNDVLASISPFALLRK